MTRFQIVDDDAERMIDNALESIDAKPIDRSERPALMRHPMLYRAAFIEESEYFEW